MSSIEEYPWTKWKTFPNPVDYAISLRLVFRKILFNPCSPGVYQLRNKKTMRFTQKRKKNPYKFILFGEGKILYDRMGSLLPRERGGVGSRNNKAKREYVWENLKDIEYRVLCTDTKKEAVEIDTFFKSLKIHKFNT